MNEEIYDGLEQSEKRYMKIEQGIFEGYACIDGIRSLRDSLIEEGNEITDIKIQYIERSNVTSVYFLCK